MGWILLIQICSIVDNYCGETMQFPKPIKTFYDCQRIAYDLGQDWLGKMDKDTVNKHRLAYKVECILPKPVDEAPESKPRVHHLHETPRHVLIFNSNQDPAEAGYPRKTPSDSLIDR
jgi:hypothetical protein